MKLRLKFTRSGSNARNFFFIYKDKEVEVLELTLNKPGEREQKFTQKT